MSTNRDKFEQFYAKHHGDSVERLQALRVDGGYYRTHPTGPLNASWEAWKRATEYMFEVENMIDDIESNLVLKDKHDPGTMCDNALATVRRFRNATGVQAIAGVTQADVLEFIGDLESVLICASIRNPFEVCQDAFLAVRKFREEHFSGSE